MPSHDPLAYKIHALPAGGIALFDGWQIVPFPAAGADAIRTFPDGREQDFQLIAAFATPGESGMASLFDDGAASVLGLAPGAEREGAPEDLMLDGDPARLENYRAHGATGEQVLLRLLMVKKKDVAVVVIGVGSSAGFEAYGRAVEIMAKNVVLTESPPDPALVGVWSRTHSYSSGSFGFTSEHTLSFSADGSFIEHSFAGGGGEAFTGDDVGGSSQGSTRGRIVRRGAVLTFHYENGTARSQEYRIIDGRALKLGGETYFRQ